VAYNLVSRICIKETNNSKSKPDALMKGGMKAA
jgi:hypothetical protein